MRRIIRNVRPVGAKVLTNTEDPVRGITGSRRFENRLNAGTRILIVV